MTGGSFTATGEAVGCAISKYTGSAAEAFRIQAPTSIVDPQGAQVKKLTLDTYYASATDFWTITNASGTAQAKSVTFGEGYTVTFDLNGQTGPWSFTVAGPAIS